jgi:hypothetical protein
MKHTRKKFKKHGSLKQQRRRGKKHKKEVKKRFLKRVYERKNFLIDDDCPYKIHCDDSESKRSS